MIIACPDCLTHFDVSETEYRPGRKARCSQCRSVFPLPEAESGQQTAAVPAAMDAVLAGETASAPDEGIAVSSGATPHPRKKSKLFVAVAVVLVLCIVGVGGILAARMFFGTSGGASPEVAGDSPLKTVFKRELTPEEKAKEEARLATVHSLALTDVRQYTITENTRVGRMVVVEGRVVNNFDTAKDLILLEITLFDKSGRPLVVREQYCGVTLSLLQLRTLPKASIESALTNQVVILNNNTDILPGGHVPFSTVFFNMPAQAYEFEVRILDVKDAAPAAASGSK